MRRPTPKINETLLANAVYLLERYGIGHFPKGPSIPFGPFAADDAVVLETGWSIDTDQSSIDFKLVHGRIA
jgi:hypothetical protein